MMNSPSSISRLTSLTATTLPKRLVRCLSVTPAIAFPPGMRDLPCSYPAAVVNRTLCVSSLTLHAAGGQAAHDIPRHAEGDHHRQDVGDHATRNLQPEVDGMAAGELGQRHRQRLGGVVVGEDKREEELVPGVEEGEDGGGREARGRER